ncbi:MAG: hypothetical protein KR126chlam1_00456 [Chlamydiae bacterium]|nr:hypothetical protein [Chlamydiota bacterium]
MRMGLTFLLLTIIGQLQADDPSSLTGESMGQVNPRYVAFDSLLVTERDRITIRRLLTTMAENNVFSLLFEKKRLERWGDEIYHVHPIRFLSVVFSDQHLIYCMQEIYKSMFKWNGFINGLSDKLNLELKAGNVQQYIPGFAALLGLSEEKLHAYVSHRDFEGLVVYLLKSSR